MGKQFDLEACDPGIRDLVVLLRIHGYNTVDSGDGVSKLIGDSESLESSGIRDYPHVVCRGNLNDAHMIAALLVSNGVPLVEIGIDGGVQIQYTLDICTGFEMIDVMGLNDADLCRFQEILSTKTLDETKNVC